VHSFLQGVGRAERPCLSHGGKKKLKRSSKRKEGEKGLPLLRHKSFARERKKNERGQLGSFSFLLGKYDQILTQTMYKKKGDSAEKLPTRNGKKGNWQESKKEKGD